MVNMVSTDGKVFESDEGIKMGSTDGKLLDTILGNTTTRCQSWGIIDWKLIGIYWW